MDYLDCLPRLAFTPFTHYDTAKFCPISFFASGGAKYFFSVLYQGISPEYAALFSYTTALELGYASRYTGYLIQKKDPEHKLWKYITWDFKLQDKCVV